MVYKSIIANISDTKSLSGRAAEIIKLVAVSKKQSSKDIKALYQQGQRAFGESYISEAINKINELKALDIEWHYIGPIQSNKAKSISEHFDWVQSVSSLKHAKLLNKFRPLDLPPLNILIQINLNNEPNKHGIAQQDLIPFAQQTLSLPRLKLRGIMAIPIKTSNISTQRLNFNHLFNLYGQLKQIVNIDTLSMGMSNDYQIAIEEGATMLRIGRAIFQN